MNVYSKTEIATQYRKQTSGYQWGEGEGYVRGMGLRDTNYYVQNR